MTSIYATILKSKEARSKMLAILIDPDKMDVAKVPDFMTKVNQSMATHVFVGGSEVADGLTKTLVLELKKHTQLPVVLFPGDTQQITDVADGILFLSLISGTNPSYLIEKQVEAVAVLEQTALEIIPTGYMLIENGTETSVERVSQTKPLSKDDPLRIIHTAKAGEYLGLKLIYLEAGSGALHPVDSAIIAQVKTTLNIPLIVGGGIKSAKALNDAYAAGADMVVIGTALESNDSFFEELKQYRP